MNALILAAGDGDRMAAVSQGTPKSLLALGGRPIIARVLDALVAAGADDVTVVTGYRGEDVRSAVTRFAPAGVRVRFVANDAPELGNARSLWSARDAVRGSFVLAMADHVVESGLILSLVDRADGRCRLAVDRIDANDVRADEATRARVQGGLVVDLGKAIADWNAVDTGVFWCTQAVFDAITPALRDGEAGAVFASLAHAGALDAVDVTGRSWIDIDTPQDLRQAQMMFA